MLRPRRRVRGASSWRAVAVSVAIAAGAAAGCGGSDGGTVRLGEAELPFVQEVGSGAQGAIVFRPPDAAPGAEVPTVVFLHGWTAIDHELYGPWILHLLAGGRQVVYPLYQEPPFEEAAASLDNAVRGLRRAFELSPADPSDVVAVGHSAGGALAEDLATTADELGLPTPRAVLAAYPGRAIRSSVPLLPEASEQGVPSGVEVVAMAGDDDRTVGTRWARRIARRAADGRFVLVRHPRADDHAAPQRSNALSRRLFWDRLDRLIRGS